VGNEFLRKWWINLKVENVRGVDMESVSGLGWKINTQVYLGRDNLGNLSVNGILVCMLDLTKYCIVYWICPVMGCLLLDGRLFNVV
jgi:hypothetical protein